MNSSTSLQIKQQTVKTWLSWMFQQGNDPQNTTKLVLDLIKRANIDLLMATQLKICEQHLKARSVPGSQLV